ncbi:FtsX-like permease family protein [Streptomyces koyangensis]|uniref:ABC transporter n=1 Tax=Streptomyces koyangensis TaxID=188770 RepID=A0ABX7EDC1_9ACTN|nr:FtsX-like permease family protein [Streptomyces koyangensis]QRF02526.1 ABC transporter [Streptomyces koyangensis]
MRVPLAVLVTLVAVTAEVAGGAAQAVEERTRAEGGPSRVTLSALEGIERYDAAGSVRPLTTAALREAAGLPGVADVVADCPATLYAEREGTYDLASHTLPAGGELPVVAGRLPEVLGARQVVLPAEAQGTDFRPALGRTVPFGYTRATGAGTGTSEVVRLEVVALYDPAWQVDGVGGAYLAEGTAAELAAARAGKPVGAFRAQDGAAGAVVAVGHQRQVDAVTQVLQEAGFAASPVADRVRQLPGLFGVADLGMRAGVGVLGLTAFVLGWVRARESARARLESFAVLRVLGGGRGDLRRLLLGEAALTGLVAGGAGLALGSGVSVALVGPLSGLLGLPIGLADALPGVGWALAALVLPVVGLGAGAWAGGRTALREDPYLAARATG